jgi:hypothetical protein
MLWVSYLRPATAAQNHHHCHSGPETSLSSALFPSHPSQQTLLASSSPPSSDENVKEGVEEKTETRFSASSSTIPPSCPRRPSLPPPPPPPPPLSPGSGHAHPSRRSHPSVCDARASMPASPAVCRLFPVGCWVGVEKRTRSRTGRCQSPTGRGTCALVVGVAAPVLMGRRFCRAVLCHR